MEPLQNSESRDKKPVIVGIAILIILILGVVIMLMKNSSKDTTQRLESSTGFENGIIDQPQVMYNGKIYYYFATGFDEELPADSEYVGAVLNVDNTKEPQNDFDGVQLKEGQKIYVSEDDSNSSIYVEYDEGKSAVFSLR